MPLCDQRQRVRVPGREVGRRPAACCAKLSAWTVCPSARNRSTMPRWSRISIVREWKPASTSADELRRRTPLEDLDVDPGQRQLARQHQARRPASHDRHVVHAKPLASYGTAVKSGARQGPCRKTPSSLYLGSGKGRRYGRAPHGDGVPGVLRHRAFDDVVGAAGVGVRGGIGLPAPPVAGGLGEPPARAGHRGRQLLRGVRDRGRCGGSGGSGAASPGGFAWPAGERVRVRMGVHTGTPTLHDGGYVGMDVHRAARIAAVAHGGQVVVSEATARLLPPDTDGVTLRDLGLHQLKDLGAPEHLFQLDIAGLETEFEAVRSLGAVSNLPLPATPLVGRDGELDELAHLLGTPEVRLVTLTGPGGSGKTRLAVAVGASSWSPPSPTGSTSYLWRPSPRPTRCGRPSARSWACHPRDGSRRGSSPMSRTAAPCSSWTTSSSCPAPTQWSPISWSRPRRSW